MNANLLPTDSELLREFVASGNDHSFEVLVRRYAALVLGVCRGVLRDATDADDAAQASFLLLARRAKSLRGRRTIAGWLHSVAWNIASRARRARERRRQRERDAAQMFERSSSSSSSPSFNPSAGASLDHDAIAELHAALCALSERYRLPLILHHLRGWSEPEVADILGCSVGTISSRLSRGRAMLKARLEKHHVPRTNRAANSGATKWGATNSGRTSSVNSGVTSDAIFERELARLEAPRRDPKSQPSETFLAMTMGIAAAHASGTVAPSIASAQAFALASGWARTMWLFHARWIVATTMLACGIGLIAIGLIAQRPTRAVHAVASIATEGDEGQVVHSTTQSGRTGAGAGRRFRLSTLNLANVKAQDVVAEGAGSINGTVVDSQGNAVVGAVVRVYVSRDDALANRQMISSALSADDGAFTFLALPPNTRYVILCSASRPVPLHAESNVAPNTHDATNLGAIVMRPGKK